ncbi:MAG: hypothetical protein M1815_004289 [Lichina confinis]|nr:MAG: hypothetical protein M1815_004289 [Lichina confinis]
MIFLVTLKENASPEELEKAKNHATEQGGKITHESAIVKSFHVEFPEDAVHSLASNEHIDVEADQEVKTQ